MRARGIWAPSLAVALWCSAARAQSPDPVVIPEPPPDAPSVTTVPSTREVMLGEQFFLFVSVTHPKGMQVNLPASLDLGPAFDEVDRTDHRIQNPDGTFTHEFEVALMAFDVGELKIPSLQVTYAAAGKVSEVPTKPVSLRVISFIGDGEETLRDIAPPVDVTRSDFTLVWIGTGVLSVILVILLVWLIIRMARTPRVARRTRAAAMHIRLPPHEEALARLDQLEGSGKLDAGDLKPAYHALSEIIRDYLGRVFAFSALDLTTLEIRNELSARPGGDPVEELVREWLEECDLVKFAGAVSTPDQARRALYDARIFVEKTRAFTTEAKSEVAESEASSEEAARA